VAVLPGRSDMPNDLSAFAAIVIIAGVTLGTRLCGAVMMQKVGSSDRVESFLEALSTSVIAAIIATVIAQGGLRETVAVVLAAMVMLASRSAVLAMIAAMFLAAVWTAYLG
jgi:uncharacterized membrane protein